MSKLFNSDSPLMLFLSAAFDFACLNAVALLCALPVVTAGASLTALYGVMLHFVNAGGSLRIGAFLKNFKTNFCRVTPIWLLFLALGGVLWMDFQIVSAMPTAVRVIACAGLVFLVLCLLLTASFFFPMAAANPATRIVALLRTAFISAVGSLPKAALMVVVNLIPLMLLLFFAKWFFFLTFLWLFFWMSLSAFFCVKLGGRRFYLMDSSEKVKNTD